MALIEIARSFSYKLNCGNYESRDFFCSQKAEVEQIDAEKTSEALYRFCKKEVMKSVKEYLGEQQKWQYVPEEVERKSAFKTTEDFVKGLKNDAGVDNKFAKKAQFEQRRDLEENLGVKTN